LNDLVWRNKYMRMEAKSKMYKASVRSITIYALETRAETKNLHKCWKPMIFGLE
jgi:hypothetical protein